MITEEGVRKTEIKLFYTIKENVNNEEIAYYPKGSIEFDKFVLCPQNESLLEFYKNNKVPYKEKISDYVKVFICFSSSYSSYNIRTGNLVKVSKNGMYKLCYLTCFSLLKPPEGDEQESRQEIFMLSDAKQVQNLVKASDEVISLRSIWDKKNYLKGNLIEKFQLQRMYPDVTMMKRRIQFIKWAEVNDHMHLFRHPVSERLITPALDLLVLTPEVDQKTNSMGIELDLDTISSHSKGVNNYITFVTYHIPRERAERYFQVTQKTKVLQKFAKQNSISNYVKNSKHMISYGNLRDPNFDENVSVFYEKTINFGSLSDFTFNLGLKCGSYSFNSQSAGTILFDLNLKAIGLACHGSFDFYPQLQQNTNEFNAFIPLSHPGVLFFLHKLLDIDYDLDHKIHRKVFKTIQTKPKGKIFQIHKHKPNIMQYENKKDSNSLEEYYNPTIGLDYITTRYIASKDEVEDFDDRTISIENNEETNLSNKQQEYKGISLTANTKQDSFLNKKHISVSNLY